MQLHTPSQQEWEHILMNLPDDSDSPWDSFILKAELSSYQPEAEPECAKFFASQADLKEAIIGGLQRRNPR